MAISKSIIPNFNKSLKKKIKIITSFILMKKLHPLESWPIHNDEFHRLATLFCKPRTSWITKPLVACVGLELYIRYSFNLFQSTQPTHTQHIRLYMCFPLGSHTHTFTISGKLLMQLKSNPPMIIAAVMPS